MTNMKNWNIEIEGNERKDLLFNHTQEFTDNLDITAAVHILDGEDTIV